jgi:predicted O-methyltransferase YrrM
MKPVIPPRFDAQSEAIIRFLSRFDGLMTRRELDFLILLAAAPSTTGDILEIGSFKGRSTILLAKAATLASQSDSKVIAVDPLEGDALWQSAEKGVTSVAAEFHSNLDAAGVRDRVEFHQTYSDKLAANWPAGRTLRVLWIDGDHTYGGAKTDWDCFSPHLADGGIVAFHDVMHGFDGPTRVFAESVLTSNRCGAAGVVGSIGWAQFHADPAKAARHQEANRTLAAKLGKVVPYVAAGTEPRGLQRLLFRLRRWQVPHAAVTAEEWCGTLD